MRFLSKTASLHLQSYVYKAVHKKIHTSVSEECA